MPRVAGDHDLLTPTMQEAGAAGDREPPWALGSQFFVAFFGGPIAVTAIAAINSWRLGQPARVQQAILGVGITSFVLSLVVAALLFAPGESSQGVRIAVQAVGIVGWGPQFLLQRSADRVFTAFDDREYAGLLGPGLGAVAAGVVIQVMAVSAVL